MYRIKPWEDLTIQDDYMFKLIMGVKRICLNLLQGILRVEIKDIHYLETEKSMDARYQGKGVRMDVYVRDDANTVYNIEMQVRMLEGESLFKRTRYYQSMIDADLLAAGADYDDLNKTVIIFICPFDPFGKGRHIYTFRNLCVEDIYCTQGCGHAERRDGVKPWQSTVPMKMIPGKANPFSCTDPEAGNCRCV